MSLRGAERRSNRIHIENNEIATFRYTSLAMTEKCHPELDSVAINVDNRLRNKCVMTVSCHYEERSDVVIAFKLLLRS